jgi:molybdopterin synthase sulfur carrier subunit
MAVSVRIPTLLQKLTGGKEEVEVNPGTVIEVIEELDKKFPGVADRVLDGRKTKKFINIYVNEDDIRSLQGEQTSVRDGDEVSMIPAIAGG